MTIKRSKKETDVTQIGELYDTLNNLDGAIYVESEGANCLRVDFNNECSVWFEECKSGRSIRGTAGTKYNKQIRKVAKDYGYDTEYLE